MRAGLVEPPVTPLPPAPAVAYGDHPLQVGNLHLPAGDGGPWPSVVLLHGGFWRSGWDRTLMTTLAHDLAARGLAAWNVEYRGTGRDGGGWPTTLLDVATAVDHLALRDELDTSRVAVCGHSAGGHLALWACGRHRLPRGSLLGSPRVRPIVGVSLAGVLDLERAATDRLDDGAVQALVGAEPEEAPDRYAAASPARLLPLGAELLLVHGTADDIVPLSQSASFAESAAAAGDRVVFRELPGVDHFVPADVLGSPWQETASWLEAALRA